MSTTPLTPTERGAANLNIETVTDTTPKEIIEIAFKGNTVSIHVPSLEAYGYVRETINKILIAQFEMEYENQTFQDTFNETPMSDRQKLMQQTFFQINYLQLLKVR